MQPTPPTLNLNCLPSRSFQRIESLTSGPKCQRQISELILTGRTAGYIITLPLPQIRQHDALLQPCKFLLPP